MFLKFDINSCKDCYSCLKHCPVKAIKFINNKAEIIEEKCVLCGKCVNVCPQNAKKVSSDIDNVYKLLKLYPYRVALSVAPSFIANFNVKNFSEFAFACKKLGFTIVEETARGAYYVTLEYKKLLDSGKYKNLISSSCPASVTLLENKYHNALKYLAPVVSPMVAHGRILQKEHGNDLHVVFVGPCIAKKKEAMDNKEIDFALTFEEINQMFIDNNIEFEEKVEEETFTNSSRFYPVTRGIIKSFDNKIDNFDLIALDNEKAIKDALINIDSLANLFIEMNMCEGGCINGPVRISTRSLMIDESDVRRYAKYSHGDFSLKEIDIDLSRTFKAKPNTDVVPSEEEIKKILERIFKYKKEDEINCGACGYQTCRDKAIAVFNGLADPEFCMPYLKNKAESISNEIIAHTPNGIITVNKNGILVDINERAFDYLQLSKEDVGKHFSDVVVLPEMEMALHEEKNIASTLVYNDKNNMYFDVSITYVKDHKIGFAIYKDVTQETLNDEKIKSLRQEMIKVTDQVINKQMAAVQEIASLLGESTAEAKIALINFKNSLKDEEQ